MKARVLLFCTLLAGLCAVRNLSANTEPADTQLYGPYPTNYKEIVTKWLETKMKLNTRLRSSGQVVVILIIILVLLGIGYWWLNSTKQEMAKGGKEFANEAAQKIVVQHDINFFGSHLSPQARMNFPVSAQQEFMNDIVQMGSPVGAIDLQGQIEFQSQFFEPHGAFHARINYPARYADFDVSISHPVGR